MQKFSLKNSKIKIKIKNFFVPEFFLFVFEVESHVCEREWASCWVPHSSIDHRLEIAKIKNL